MSFRRTPPNRLLGLLVVTALLTALPLAARDISFDESCFPTCSTTDGRFLIIAAGTALSTLSDETLRLKFAVDEENLDPGDPTFTFEIFDGDSNRDDNGDGTGEFHWDIGAQAPVLFELFAIETLADGTEIQTQVPPSQLTLEAGTAANPFSSQITFDNDWFSVTVEVGPEALVANTGDYRYLLQIVRDPGIAFDPSTQSLLNALKVRTDESVFLSLLEQPFAFEAKWTNLADITLIYPNFDFSNGFDPADAVGPTYDGSFTFYLNLPPPLPGDVQTSLSIFDGDLDHGNADGTDPDTDDPDTCYPTDISGCTEVALPFAPGPAVNAESAATPAPADDNAFFLNVRPPAVRYRVIFPENTDPGTIVCGAGALENPALIEGRRSIINANPSADQEWEKFTITTDPLIATEADCQVDLIPAGVYRIDLIGMDMNNLNAWFFGEDICGLQPDRDPLCPEGLFLLGDTVWLDTDGDGNGDPAEIAADGESGIPGVIVRLRNVNGTTIRRTLTDADGLYNFTVGAGEYTVEMAPENFLTGVGQPTGAVGDRVWLDGNGNGSQDPSEPGIPGVEVQLIDAGPNLVPGGGDDLVLDSTVTDRNGNYLFTGLPPANYFVNVIDATVPAGLSISGGTDPSAVYALAAGETYLGLDFGYTNAAAGTALIGDFVWHDLNDNGVQEANEPGISGVTVALFDVNVSLTIPVATAVTRGGYYLFTGVAPGDYQVEVTDDNGVLAGYSLATGSVNPIGPFSVAVGDALLDKDFGYVNAGLNSIADRVWFDTDRNGLLDGAEVGIGGVTVTLIGDTGLPMATVTTAADGSFSFDGLPDGPYSLLITDLAGNLNGLIPTTAPALVGSKGVNLAGSDVTGINFGFVDRGALAGALATTASPTQTDQIVDANVLTYDFGYRFGSVGDRLWRDDDGDGNQDGGEPGLNGVTVELLDAGGNVVATTVTSGDGNYTFTDLPAGTYSVRINPATLPLGLLPTFDLDGIGTPDLAVFLLAPGQDRTDVDFGYRADMGDVCLPDLDFETDAAGANLVAGQIIDDEFAGFGIAVTTHDPVNHPAMIFDSASPTGGDFDLGSPNQTFGGPGVGAGGEAGQPGENGTALNKVLIISEDGDSSDPDDNGAGGTLIFTFDIAVRVDEVEILDIDEGMGGTVKAFDAGGAMIGMAAMSDVLGDNSFQTVYLGALGVRRLEVHFPGSGSVAGINFCVDASVCLPTLDFDTDGVGDQLATGQVIDDEFMALGVLVTTGDPINHPAMIFDSAAPTGGDIDLGAPNQDFGGPGVGTGGAAGQPGQNDSPLGKVLIISEDGDSSDPDDDAGGGTIIFNFIRPVELASVGILDIDGPEAMGTVTAFDGAGQVLASAEMQPLGDNSVQTVAVPASGVRRLEVMFPASGAVTEVVFCPDDTGDCRNVTVRDNFDVSSFGNNDGPDNWAGPWIEDDPESGGAGPNVGQVRVVGGALRLDDQPDTGGQPSAAREVDLSASDSATLFFKFDTTSGVDTSDAVTVEVSSNGGGSWQTLEVITGIAGATWGERTYDISGQISSETQVRFRVSNLYGGSDEYFFVTEVEIHGRCIDCQPVTVRDEFSQQSFNNNDGPDNWAGPWIENDPESGGAGPNAGQVRVVGGALRLDDQPDTGGQPSAARQVDLSASDSATLFFKFDTSVGVDTSDAVTVEVSPDGGASWQTLEVITGIYGATWDERTYDISGQISAQTRVRFRVSAYYGGGDEYFHVTELEVRGRCTDSCQPVKVRDEFSYQSFNNNDGPDGWSAPWSEDDVAGPGAAGGNVRVYDGRLKFRDYTDTGTEPSAARTVDLSTAAAATLSFDFWTTGGVDTSDAVTLEISSDGGATYTTLETFTGIAGASDGWRSYDISDYISDQTTVRFRVSAYYGADNEWFKVDNVEIDATCP